MNHDASVQIHVEVDSEVGSKYKTSIKSYAKRNRPRMKEVVMLTRAVMHRQSRTPHLQELHSAWVVETRHQCRVPRIRS